MTKKQRQKALQQTMKTMKWTLPSNDPDTCSRELWLDSGEYRLKLQPFRSSGCACFSGIQVQVAHRNLYTDQYTVTVVEARPFSGYKAFNRWMEDLQAKLKKELREKIEADNYAKLQAFMGAK